MGKNKLGVVDGGLLVSQIVRQFPFIGLPSQDRSRVSRCRAGDPLPDGRKRPAGVFQLRAFFFGSSFVRCDPVWLVSSCFAHGSHIGGFRGSCRCRGSSFIGRFTGFVRASFLRSSHAVRCDYSLPAPGGSSLVVRFPFQVVRWVCKFRKVASHTCSGVTSSRSSSWSSWL